MHTKYKKPGMDSLLEAKKAVYLCPTKIYSENIHNFNAKSELV